MMYVLIAIVVFIVGLSIGICGVAGFLLPIFFLGYCGFTSSESLFLSFGCFLISGVIGSYNYKKRGELPLDAALPLSFSSLTGAAIGAWIGTVYVAANIRTVLYIVVLVSGAMILVQDYLQDKRNPESDNKTVSINTRILIIVGFLTALICALSGAGGPVMVMPILILLGLPVRNAVGASLFGSIFIAIPSILVYGMQTEIPGIIWVMIITFSAHTAGIFLGSKEANRVPQRTLKLFVAVFSVIFGIWKLLGI